MAVWVQTASPPIIVSGRLLAAFAHAAASRPQTLHTLMEITQIDEFQVAARGTQPFARGTDRKTGPDDFPQTASHARFPCIHATLKSASGVYCQFWRTVGKCPPGAATPCHVTYCPLPYEENTFPEGVLETAARSLRDSPGQPPAHLQHACACFTCCIPSLCLHGPHGPTGTSAGTARAPQAGHPTVAHWHWPQSPDISACPLREPPLGLPLHI